MSGDAPPGPAAPAFRQELAQLIPRLRRFARGLTGQVADADDLVQAALERALVRHVQWQPGTRLDSWVFRIAHTIWLDELRSRKVRMAEPEEALERVVGDDGNRRVEARLTLDAVRRAMAHLPEEQRAVMMLVCVEGMSYKEAAEALAIPVGTVMSRLSRGRQALFAELGEGAWP